MNASAPQLVDLVEIGTVQVAVDQQHDGEPDADLGGGDRDDEEGEDLTGDLVQVRRERDQVEVHGVEHQLDAHEDEHAVAPGEHAVDADAEQRGGEDQELVQDHQSRLAITTAPT